MKPEKVIYVHRKPAIENGKWVEVVDEFEVRIMAIAEGYAMVRRKCAMPFVCNVKDLREL